MANYSYSSNIGVSGGAESNLGRNVNPTDTLTLTLSCNYSAQVLQLSNARVVSVSNSTTGSFSNTATIVIGFVKSGTYKVGVKNAINTTHFFISGSASGATQYNDDGYGLQVYNSTGDLRLDFSKRQPRYEGFVNGTGAMFATGYYEPVSGWESNGEWFACNTKSQSNWYVTGASNSTGPFIQRNETRSSNYSYQIFLGSEDYSLLILRS